MYVERMTKPTGRPRGRPRHSAEELRTARRMKKRAYLARHPEKRSAWKMRLYTVASNVGKVVNERKAKQERKERRSGGLAKSIGGRPRGLAKFGVPSEGVDLTLPSTKNEGPRPFEQRIGNEAFAYWQERTVRQFRRARDRQAPFNVLLVRNEYV
jgi:hypothetical protein